jgi:hypothetical protein
VRRFLLLIGLIIGLLAAVQLSRAAAGWRFIVPDTAGTLLYATGFDAASDEWAEADDGRRVAQVRDGVLHLALEDATNSVYAPLRWVLHDFDLTVEATAVGGSDNNGFGVIFRQTDARNYYYFLISSDGYYQLSRVVDDVARKMSNWIPSHAIQTGLDATNQVRIVAQGDQFEFYVNDEPLAMCIPDSPDAESTFDEFAGECLDGQMLTTFTDATLAYGRVGLIATSLDDPTEITFDHLVIYSPAETE